MPAINPVFSMFFVLFTPDASIVAAFANHNDAINFILAHSNTYGFVPNQDMVITDMHQQPILSVLPTAE